MKLYCYQSSIGLTYTDQPQKIGKLINEVEAEHTNEPITNHDVIYANIGIFKVKMKIK